MKRWLRGSLPTRAFTALGGISLAASCSCGDKGTVASSGQGGKPAASSSVWVSAQSSTAGGSPPKPEPCPDWPGWETWDDFGPLCDFCVPASKDALPEPIVWEPCDARAGMPTGCRTMKPTWPSTTGPVGIVFSADVVDDNKVVLRFTRHSETGSHPYLMRLVADADGVVRSAFIVTGIKPVGYGCSLYETHRKSLRHGKTLFKIEGDNPAEKLANTFPGAIVGGDANELHPKVLGSWDNWSGPGIATTDLYWGTYDSYKIELATWGGELKTIFTSGQAGGLQQTFLNPWHDLVLWESGDLTESGIMAWTAKDGPYPFITFPGDTSKGASALGTDGVDMVWAYGEGKGPGEEPYPKCSVMTSPFTKDPKLLKPKRLRSFPGSCHEVAEWEVGCGHAAHDTEDGTMVVRLSDGVSWLIKGLPPKDGDPFTFFSFQEAVAITCNEVFVRTNVGSVANIGRVELAALGPGIPPD